MSYFRRMAMAMPIPSPIDGYVKDGLILAYDGYQEPSGGVWKDLSPSHNDMVLTDGYDFDADGHSLHVIKGNDHTTREPVYFAANFTIEVVVRLNVSGYNSFLATSSWALMLYNASLYFRTYTVGYICTPNISATGATTALQVAYGDTCEARFYRNYRNTWAKEKGALNHTAPISYKLYFGTSKLNVDANIYALRIYDRKLTDEELLNNRLLDAQRFNVPTTNIDNI